MGFSPWAAPSHVGKWMHGVFFTNPSLNPLKSVRATNHWKDILCMHPKIYIYNFKSLLFDQLKIFKNLVWIIKHLHVKEFS
jgi:hypothetical protein